MKYVKQFGIILIVTFIAEIMANLLPLPVPASIYGLVLMLVSLLSGIIKLADVKETGEFLVEIMPIMFIPAAVGLLDSYQALKGVILQVAVIIVVSTIVVMAVAGRVSQRIIKKRPHRQEQV